MTWGNLITGLLVEGLSRIAQPQATGGVESLLAELGWAIDERQGDAAVFHFESPEGIRKLSVRTGEDGVTVFATASFAAFRSIPPEVAQYLLGRTGMIPAGSWALTQVDQGVVPCLVHRSTLGGMSAAAFRAICQGMVQEACELDNRLRAAGLLA